MTLLTNLGPVFYKLVYMSLTAVAAGAAVLLLRRLTDKRFPPLWKYAMWVLVLAALIIPWRPQSRAAVLSPAEAVQDVSFRDAYSQAQADYSAVIMQVSQTPQALPEVEAARKEVVSLRVKTLAFDELLPLLWLCGIAVAALFMGTGAIRLRRRVSRSEITDDMGRYEELLERCKRRLGMKRRVRIVLQPHVGSPALLGLLRPVILLPGYAAGMSDARLEYVILHELSHLRRGDGIINALLLALRAVYWFNPLVWLLFRCVREDMELANDAAVLRGMGAEARKEYSLSLVEVLMGCAVPPPGQRHRQRHAMLCMTDGKKNIERRIGMIQLSEFFKRRKWLIAVAGILVIAGIAALFLTTGINRSESYNFDGAGVTVTMQLPRGMSIPAPPGAVGDQFFMGQRAIHKAGQSVGMLLVDPLEDISELLRELPADVDDYREVWASADGTEGSVTLLCDAGTTRAVLAYNLTLNRYVQITLDYGALTDREHVALAKSLRLRHLPPEQRQGEIRQFQHGNLVLEITKVADVETKTTLDHGTDPYDYAVYTLYPGAQLTVINADMYDGVDFEDGLPHGKYYVYDSSKGLGEEIDEYIWITDSMPPFTITPDMTHVGVEMVGVLRFEWFGETPAQDTSASGPFAAARRIVTKADLRYDNENKPIIEQGEVLVNFHYMDTFDVEAWQASTIIQVAWGIEAITHAISSKGMGMALQKSDVNDGSRLFSHQESYDFGIAVNETWMLPEDEFTAAFNALVADAKEAGQKDFWLLPNNYSGILNPVYDINTSFRIDSYLPEQLRPRAQAIHMSTELMCEHFPFLRKTNATTPPVTDPNFDAVALFKRLEGYWNDHYEYPGFTQFMYRDGKPSLYGGVWDGEANAVGTMTGGKSVGEGIAALTFWYPAIDEWPGPWPERTETMWIDFTGLDNGTIRIKRETYWGTKDWHDYTFGGKTKQEAAAKSFAARPPVPTESTYPIAPQYTTTAYAP